MVQETLRLAETNVLDLVQERLDGAPDAARLRRQTFPFERGWSL